MLTQTTKDAGRNDGQGAMIQVYGYGPANNPFYKEALQVKVDSDHYLLLLSAPVSCGQKLLLINEQGPIEAEIVRIRPVDAQMSEIGVTLTRRTQ